MGNLGRARFASRNWLKTAKQALATVAAASLIITASPAVAAVNDEPSRPAETASAQAPVSDQLESASPSLGKVSETAALKKGLAFKTTSTPSITGTAKVGSKLTVKVGAWSPKASFEYKWYRNNSAIKGATKRTYTPVAADLGKSLKVRITAKAKGYRSTSKTSKARKISSGTIKVYKSLKITGTPRFGKTISASAKFSGETKVSYQWYKNGKKVKGATKKSLKLTAKDINAKYKVRITATKSGYKKRSLTSNSVKISKALFSVKSAPKISGSKSVGKTLKATKGSFSPKATAYSYQWLRNGKAIKKATKSSYKITSSDRGFSISVRVTAKKKNYSNKSSTSKKVSIAKKPATAIKHDGTYRIGSNLKPGLYKSTGSGSSCYWERLDGFSGSFDDIKSNYFGSARSYVRILASDKGFSTSECGTWIKAPSTGAKSSTISKDGTYRVGIDIKPGLYKSTNTGSCYWETVMDFTGDFEDLITNDFNYDRSIVVDIPRDSMGFTKSGCGTLKRISN
ncbi:hypothetical protein [Glutamicibacter arilaitensis]|uniref:hypothetical protein n=1 Tax=Glutamicibacter arilaitensis TaxID=256701 RepID=UPI003A8CAABD